MPSSNPFLAHLEKEIALAIQGDADSRANNGQRIDSAPEANSAQQSYSVEELAELTYYSAQSAVQIFQQDLSRQQSRLSLGLDPAATPSSIPIAPADLLAQIAAVIQFHNWLPAANQNLRTALNPGSAPLRHPTNAEILINQLYQEETRSFELQNQLTQDTLVQARRGHLKQNFTLFFTQLPTEAKNQLIAEIPPEIVLQNSIGQGQASVLNWITRALVKQRALQFQNPPTPLSAQLFSELLAERAETAKQLKNGAKLVPGRHLQETRKSTLALLQESLNPGAFPEPAAVASATIDKLGSLLSGFPFPLEAVQTALAKNVSDKTGQSAEGKLWARQHTELKAQYDNLPAAQQAEILKATGSLQPALACALFAACKESPRQKGALLHLSSLLTTGEMSLEPTLENINSLLSAVRQLDSEKQSLQIKIDPSLKQVAHAAFNNTDRTGLDPVAFSALRRFKIEGDELISKLQGIIASRSTFVFATTESPLAMRLERAVALTELHPVLRQGITDTEITNEIVNLLKERQNPFQTLQELPQHLHIARLVEKISPQEQQKSLHPLQKAALAASEKQNPPIFHWEVQNAIHSSIGQANQIKTRETLRLAAELLRYLPLQPPPDRTTVELTAHKLITEILRHAKSHQNSDLEKQFTNPSLDDMRLITYQAQKEIERKLSDKIARTLRKNAEILEQQTLALTECFQSPLELAKAWTRKQNADATLDELRQTKATQLTTQIQSLQTALTIIEQAKELQTIDQFKEWITSTHARALQSAQAEYQHDPFNITLRNRVTELTQFKPEIETARTATKDPSSNLDIRVVWDILAQNKANIEHQIHQLQNQQHELQRVARGIANAQSVEDKSGSKRSEIAINSLSHAFDEAFKKKARQTTEPITDGSPQDQQYQWTNPFQGEALELIIEAGSRQLQLRAQTLQLHQYWTNLIGLPNGSSHPARSGNTNEIEDPGAQIKAVARLLLFHEIAKHPAKPDLPSELNQIWRTQPLHPKTPKGQIRPDTTKPEKTFSPVSL